MIEHINEFFQNSELENLEEYLRKSSWEWGYHSNGGFFKGIPHWSIIFAGPRTKVGYHYDCEHELKDPIKSIWNQLKLKYFKDDVLVRCYANAITNGLDQKLHIDDSDSTSKTFVLYVNKIWNVDWSGETIVWEKESRTITDSVLPKFNTGIIIPGYKWHGVRPVSRYCDDIRITLMFKTRSKDASLEISQSPQPN
jgi:SM-20-related protein